ncbi:MAG: DUF302 domain-containing protein [Candidatus Sedimenticola sp. PURPLELP]
MNRFHYVLLALLIMTISPISAQADNSPEVHINDISQTVIRMSMIDGVSFEDAAQAMTSKAAELNLKLVGHQKVHQEMLARGKEAGHLEIVQFCDPEDAVKMVELDPLYAAYMPCRIALVEDRKTGRGWLLMLNLDMLINSHTLPPELQAIAIRINQAMLAVMTAGATGEF